MKNGKSQKKKVIKIEGVDIQKCSDSFLSSKLGTYKATIKSSRIVSLGFALFFIIFTGLTKDPSTILIGIGAGFIFIAMFWGLTWPLVPKVKAIEAELARRTNKDKTKQEELNARTKASSNKYIKIVVIGLIVGLLIGIVLGVLGNLSNDKNENECRTCGRETALLPDIGICPSCFSDITD